MTTLHTLQTILINDYRLTRDRLGPDAELIALGLDSLSVLELMFKIEDSFFLTIGDDTPTDLVTMNDVVRFIDGLLISKEASAARASAPLNA